MKSIYEQAIENNFIQAIEELMDLPRMKLPSKICQVTVIFIDSIYDEVTKAAQKENRIDIERAVDEIRNLFKPNDMIFNDYDIKVRDYYKFYSCLERLCLAKEKAEEILNEMNKG